MDRKRSEYTSSAFARSVLMTRPNGMMVEVNDEGGPVPRSQTVRSLPTPIM